MYSSFLFFLFMNLACEKHSIDFSRGRNVFTLKCSLDGNINTYKQSYPAVSGAPQVVWDVKRSE